MSAAKDAPTFKDHFSARAADYAARRPSYPPALADWLAGLARRSGLAWEAGCGSGQLSALLGERFDRVLATDASARQIANAAPYPRVDYLCAAAEASGLEAGTADLIVAAQAAHWFDLEAFYAEARRIARPGAAIALVCYPLPAVEPGVDAVLHRFHDRRMGPYWPPERAHVDAGYSTLPFPFPEIQAPDLTMTADWTLEDLLGYLDTWSAVRQFERAEGRSPIPELRAELASAWPANGRAAVRWPLFVRAGRVGDGA